MLRWPVRPSKPYRPRQQMSTSTFGDLLRGLDPRPEVRLREFERVCRWFLLNSPEYRARIRNVWLWSDWPGAWGLDSGIDLVAEEPDGGLRPAVSWRTARSRDHRARIYDIRCEQTCIHANVSRQAGRDMLKRAAWTFDHLSSHWDDKDRHH